MYRYCTVAVWLLLPNVKHQRARAEVSRVKDELSVRALRCMRKFDRVAPHVARRFDRRLRQREPSAIVSEPRPLETLSDSPTDLALVNPRATTRLEFDGGIGCEGIERLAIGRPKRSVPRRLRQRGAKERESE